MGYLCLQNFEQVFGEDIRLSMSGETIGLIANLAIALSFITAIIFGIAQVRAAERDRAERLTLETLRYFQSREFARQLQYFRDRKSPATAEEMQALPVDEQVTYIQFAQEMESLGLLVAEGLLDLDLVDKTLGSYVSLMWTRFEPFMLHMRETIPDPYLAEYFQWLARRVEERMNKKPRAPYHTPEGERAIQHRRSHHKRMK
jgi:hypothetical protein